jgi:hypothetical protein
MVRIIRRDGRRLTADPVFATLPSTKPLSAFCISRAETGQELSKNIGSKMEVEDATDF